MRLTLLCNAATQATRQAAFPLDEPAEPSGLTKAAAIAAALGRVDAIWTSPSLRALQTGEAAGAATGCRKRIDADLREMDFGRWAGMRLVDVEASEPAAVLAWSREPDAAPHGGESVTAFMQRVSAWLARMASEEGRVLAVTHASVIRAAIVQAIGAPASAFWRIDIDPLGRVELRNSSGLWTLRLNSP